MYDEQPGDSNSGRKVVGRMSTQYIGAKKWWGLWRWQKKRNVVMAAIRQQVSK